MQEARESMQGLAAQDGLYLRLVFGKDTAEVMLAARGLVREFGGPLAAVPKLQLVQAARALSALQRAGHAAEVAQGRTGLGEVAALPEDSVRWARYAIAAFGGLRAGIMFDDKGAIVREESRVRQEARELQKQTTQQAFAALKEAAESSGEPLAPTRSERWQEVQAQKHERKVEAQALKRERQDARQAGLLRRREEKQQKKASAKQGRGAANEAASAEDAAQASSFQGVASPFAAFAAAVPPPLSRTVSADEREDAALAAEVQAALRQLSLAEPGSAAVAAAVLDNNSSSVERFYSTDDFEKEETESFGSAANDSGKLQQLSRAERRLERQALAKARAREKEAIHAEQLQKRQALAAAEKRLRVALLQAKEEGREALRAALADMEGSFGGRGRLALACAGIENTEQVEVVHFEEAKAPPPGQPHVPGQLIAIDREKGCVVVALRGSSCLRDALVDLDCRPQAVCFGGIEGLAHGGMLQAAQQLAEPLAAVVEAALERVPDGSRRVLLVGHSLGGGVAALLNALWHEGEGRLPVTEMHCLAFGCPQVLDRQLAAAQAHHTTSVVVGVDCVPCLSLATCSDLRDALVAVADPASRGLDAAFGSAQVLQAAAEENRQDELVERYRAIRQIVGSAPHRLYPAGLLVKHIMGEEPRLAEYSVVDEMVVTTDMVAGHMPRRYLASCLELEGRGFCRRSLWSVASSPFAAGLALAMRALPRLSVEATGTEAVPRPAVGTADSPQKPDSRL